MTNFLYVALASLAVMPVEAPDSPPRPNILWLISEDMSPDLGCYGEKQVSTPNIDRLASQGMRFTNAYTTAPVCSASRSTFMTGMYQTTIGAHNHRSHRDDGYQLPDGVRPLTDWMRDAGYFTDNVVTFPKPIPFKGAGKTDWNFAHEPKPFDSKNWSDLKGHQPFLAQVNFPETHRPYHAPKHADPAEVNLPPIYPDHSIAREDWAKYLDAVTALDRKVGQVLDQLENDGLADNTVVVFMSDHGESHVRGKQFCYDDGLRIPLIIRWPKGFPAPSGYQPASVSDRLIEAIDLAPTFLDLAGSEKPAKMQGRILFGDHADPPREYAFAARDRCDETVMRFRTVRDKRYRYIRNFMPEKPFFEPNAYKAKQYPVWNLIPVLDAEGKLTPWQKAFYMAPHMPEEELYDMQNDPWSMHNLADSTRPEDKQAHERLRKALEDWISRTDDQGRFPEKNPPEAD